MAKPVRHRNKWRIRWIDENGRRRSETYDSRSQAEIMLQRHLLWVKEIRLGLRTGYCPDKTFNDLADFWLQTYAPTKRSFKHDESIIEHHLRPEFGSRKLSEIGPQHVDRYRLSRRNLAIKTVANHVTLLKSMLNKAVDIGWLSSPPRFKVPRTPRSAQDYSYLRTDEEIQRFLSAAWEEGEHAWIFYKAAIYTGMRAGELAGLRREDIDLETGIITIQRSFDGPTKSGEIRRVPLFDVLEPSLKAWLLKLGSMPVVFPNQAGRMHQPSARIFQETLHRVLERAGFPNVQRNGKTRRYIVFHSLRHTFASHWMMRGGDIFKLQKLLGHQSTAMTQRYAHLSPSAFDGEFGRFGACQDGFGEVVELPRNATNGGRTAEQGGQ